MNVFQRIGLRTGIKLNVALAGPQDGPAVILLHGFPESHRTWRELAPRLENRFRLIIPDQRGFAGSDRPREVDAYRTDKLVDDVFALADVLGLDRFALVGHDWGGALAWAAALRRDPRLTRLAVINAPHPAIFQKSLIEHREQRIASQYIRWFRSRSAEQAIEAMGLEQFFERVIGENVNRSRLTEAERQQYLVEWAQPGALTAMLNWYRASKLIVPPTAITMPVPDIALRLSPAVRVPTLVIWGIADRALLPVQLEGLDHLVDDLAIVRLPGVGHFTPWEAPDDVVHTLAPFLAGEPLATARA